MCYIKLPVLDAIRSMLAKPADILPLEFQNIKKKSPAGEHLIECYGTAHSTKCDIRNSSNGVDKLVSLEAINTQSWNRN